ncbi:MAG: hypothetical protein HQ557_06350 [Bacteroidetes bacterium]|nr:hypothetical protein [Bacteroidota bacterium]
MIPHSFLNRISVSCSENTAVNISIIQLTNYNIFKPIGNAQRLISEYFIKIFWFLQLPSCLIIKFIIEGAALNKQLLSLYVTDFTRNPLEDGRIIFKRYLQKE